MWPACGTDNYAALVDQVTDVNGVAVGVTVPASTPVDNPTFVDIGGTVYEGQPKPLCDMKLVRLSDRKSIAPGFNLFTDVPLPGRFWGLIVDDLNFSSNPQSLLYGEKMGIPFAPVGIYDYTNRLITTVESDYNGLFDVLLPSTNRISCPTPSGVCANLYRFVGNDPGVPGQLECELQPAVPHHLGGVRSLPRPDRSRRPGAHPGGCQRFRFPARRLSHRSPARWIRSSRNCWR